MNHLHFRRLLATLLASLLLSLPALAEAAPEPVENAVEALAPAELNAEGAENSQDEANPGSADYSLDIRSNKSFTVCVGDALNLAFARAPLTSLISSDPSVAEIESCDLDAGTARVIARATGKAKLVAKAGRSSLRVTLNVVARDNPTRVKLPEKKLTLNAGESYALAPIVTPATATPEFTWKSSKPAVAEVDDTGLVTAVEGAEGTAKITVKASNGKKASVNVKVVNPCKPTSVAFESNEIVISLDQTVSLKPVLTPEDARSTFTWKSSRPSVASVDADGRVTGHKLGHARITVRTSNGKTASVTVRVKDLRPTGLALMLNHEQLLEEGATAVGYVGYYTTLTAVLSPEMSYATYTCSVSDEDLLQVVHFSPDDPNIYIGCVTVGTSTVTVETSNGLKASLVIEVKDPTIPTGVAIQDGASVSVDMGGTRTLTAVLSNEYDAASTYTWSTSDPGVAQVTSDSPDSPVCCVSGVACGTATITVETRNGLSASCEVTVKQPGPAPRPDTKYRALLIGEDNFYWGPDEGWERFTLNSEAADKLMQTLNGVSGPAGGKYDVTVKINTDLAGTEAAIREAFAGADDDDVSLFYITSHGNSEETDEYAGALGMASLKEALPERFKLDRLARLLSAVPGKVIVLIDTCGSGAAVAANGGDDFDAARKACAAFDAAVVSAFAAAEAKVSDGVASNIGELRVPNKFYVLCSSAYLEASWSHWEGTHGGSYFTDWLTEGIGRSGDMPADRQFAGNGDGVADLYELYKYVTGVGDTFAVWKDGVDYYQHVQVYPADTRYEMFRQISTG